MGKVTGFLEFDRVENKSISPKPELKITTSLFFPFLKKH